MLFAVGLWCASAHGTWVYQRHGLDEERLRLIEKSPNTIGLNEVYVSLQALSPDDAATPDKLRRLKRAGLRVEALIDGENPEKKIERIVAFNRRQADAQSRFDGVHYDFEPWIGTGASTAWVQKVNDMYGRAKTALAGLPLSADMSGVKLAALSDDAHRALRQNAPRLVLMQYESTPERIVARSEAALQKAAGLGVQTMIAVRVKDLGCDGIKFLQRFDAEHQKSEGYVGWALFDYDEYASQCLTNR